MLNSFVQVRLSRVLFSIFFLLNINPGAECAEIDLSTPGYSFKRDDHIVSAYVFHWYTVNDGQMSGPWLPLGGRDRWSGETEFWVDQIKQVMAANIDVIFVHLIDSFEDQRVNLFKALFQLRQQGYDVPKLAPFFDPEVTWHQEPVKDLQTAQGKNEFIGQYIRFYRQYFSVNKDQHAEDYLAQIDGKPVLIVWHMHLKMENLESLSRDDLEKPLKNALGRHHSAFSRGIYLITQPVGELPNGKSRVVPFADERVHQFDDTDLYVQLTEHEGITAAQLKAGYWDQNVRNPGAFLPRTGGTHYSEAWESILKSSAQRVYIESFNEYDEGTGIYVTDLSEGPSISNQTMKDRDVWSSTDNPYEYIDQTYEYASRFNDRPELAARILSHNIPSRLVPGHKVTANILVRNEGDERWSSQNGFSFRVMDDGVENGFSANVSKVESGIEIINHSQSAHRGQPCRFEVELIAPEASGSHLLKFSMWKNELAFGEILSHTVVIGDQPVQYFSTENAVRHSLVKANTVRHSLAKKNASGNSLATNETQEDEYDRFMTMFAGGLILSTLFVLSRKKLGLSMNRGLSLENQVVASRMESISNRHVLLILTGIVLIGLVLRAHQLTARSFWFDEAFSWRLSQFPLAEMIDRAIRDNNPPLYYLLLRAWTEIFGESSMSLRSLSVLMGGFTVIAVYLFGSEAFVLRGKPDDSEKRKIAGGREIGLLAAALLSFSVYQIRWSWEVRMYALGTALVALSGWALFRALRKGTFRSWVLYSVILVLFGYTHSYAVFSITAQWIFLVGYLWYEQRKDSGRAFFNNANVRGALSALIIFVLCWSPWLPVMLNQRDQVQEAFWSAPLSALHVNMAFYEMFIAPEDPPVWPTVALVSIVLCSLLSLSCLWKGRRGHYFVFCSSVIPILLSILVSLASRNIFHVRYLLFTHVFILVALAILLCRIPFPVERRMISGWVLLVFLSVAIYFKGEIDFASKPGGQAASALIDNARSPDEPVIVCSPLLYYSLLYHSSDRSSWFMYDDGRQPYIHYYGTAVLEPETLLREEQIHAKTSNRIWVADMHGGGWGVHRVPVPFQWRLIESKSFPEVYGVQGTITVKLYETSERKLSSKTDEHHL